MKNELKYVKIKEIALNPIFCSNECYNSLENQGFSVHWMTEDEKNDYMQFSIIVDKNE